MREPDREKPQDPEPDDALDEVDRASADSFPASDPPSTSSPLA